MRIWRWRTETALAAATGAVAVLVIAALREGDWWPFLALTSTVMAPAVTSSGRGRIRAHLYCVVSRHRIQRVCMEIPSLHTRTGRIPLIMRITPTAAGERVVIMTRAGICASDFRAHAEEIAAACLAQRVTVSRHPRRANMIIVEIVRRGASTPVGLSPEFERLYGETGWTTPRKRSRETGEEPRGHGLPRTA
ncbi:hypothetical protein [Planobispora longispora]|uniref:hypothetical protein n=1 Tax=Planobispora longispora TaxID=28887 RepID=UPI001940D37C|nr:hypothetical protein [Planobispora longispora]